MAFVCGRCGKGKQFGRKIGRARQGLNYRSPKIFKPNLHAFKGILNGQKGHYKLCTKCLRIAKKQVKQTLNQDTPGKIASK